MLRPISLFHRLSDDDLLHRVRRESNGRALNQLLQRHLESVMGLCLYYLGHAEDAEDATMEILAKATQSIRDGKEIRSFKDWLFIIGRNHCFQRLKQRERFHTLFSLVEDTKTADIFMQLPAEDALYTEQYQKMDNLLRSVAALKAPQRDCITAFFLQEKSYKEIAEERQEPLDRVRSYIQNGRRNLRVRLSADSSTSTI